MPRTYVIMIDKLEDDLIRFHMPGHSGANIDDALYSVAKYDITELDYSDNLAMPEGVLRDTEENIARIYHAKRALMLTEGATAGIQVALLVAREEAGKLYLLGNTHKSCISFASVIGLTVENIDSVDRAVELASQGKWIYVTTPNYFGEVIDIERVLEARANGSAVIVDEAHGAHFVFSPRLPMSYSDKADFVVESLHKTLPVFTGGACININNEKYLDMATYFKCKIHSTSPSYLIMQSIDYAMRLFDDKGEEMYEEVFAKVEAFKKTVDSRYEISNTADFTRLVINVNNAPSVASYLESKGVYIELFDNTRLVLIVTPWNAEKLEETARLLNTYSHSDDAIESEHAEELDFRLSRATKVTGRLQFLALDEAIGKVSMSEIAVYPPGVPIVVTGDILDAAVIEYIRQNRNRIVGLIGDTIAVRDICEED